MPAEHLLRIKSSTLTQLKSFLIEVNFNNQFPELIKFYLTMSCQRVNSGYVINFASRVTEPEIKVLEAIFVKFILVDVFERGSFII